MERANGIRKPAIIVVDGIFFQIQRTGIARLWENILRQWAGTDFGDRILVVDRGSSAPRIPGIRTIDHPRYEYTDFETDRASMQAICDREDARLFVSTYYTTPLTTPSIFFAYDMIPEFAGILDVSNSPWPEKHFAIRQAIGYVAISHSTARDLERFHPPASGRVSVAHCGVSPETFHPASPGEIDAFRRTTGMDRPYFLYVGSKLHYKNAILFLEAFSQMPDRDDLGIVFCGGEPLDENGLSRFTGKAKILQARLDDTQLRAAYSGAEALVHPSLYEGFGLPLLEAMACGCPVVACRNSSIPEVAGDAAILVEPATPDRFREAMVRVRDPDHRSRLLAKGFEQARTFTWGGMADGLRRTFEAEAADDPVREARSEARLGKARVLLAQDDWDGAMRSLLDAAAAFPGDKAVLDALSWLRIHSGDLTGEMRAAMDMVRVFPSDPDSFMALAKAFLRRGRRQEAGEAIERALALDPSCAAAAAMSTEIDWKSTNSQVPMPSNSGRTGITAIVYGRNDSHGQNLHKRATISLNCLAEQLEPGRDEILFVDCNSADDVPTFPESIRDILTDRARSLLRVLRLRPRQYADRARGASAPVLEALCRNVALRRSSPTRPWILSTNTDIAVRPKSGTRLTDLVGLLPDALHGAPRFDIPQGLWETLDRTDPSGCLERMGSWMERLGLRNAAGAPWDFVRWDNPGDFQLFLREDLVSMGGFDESMIDGPYHVDSNMARRVCLERGPARSLDSDLEVYHCDHSRQTMARQNLAETEGNDWNACVMRVSESDIATRQPEWGAKGEDLEEIRLVEPDRRFETVLEGLVRRDGTVLPVLPGNQPDSNTHIPLDRILPFLLDHLLQLPKSRRIAVLSFSDDLPLAVGRACASLGLGARVEHIRPGAVGSRAALASNPDVMVVDPGTRNGPVAIEPLAGCIAHFAQLQSGLPNSARAKVLLLLAHQSWLGNLGRRLFDLHFAPTDTWIFHGKSVDREHLPQGLPALPDELPRASATTRGIPGEGAPLPTATGSASRIVAIDARTLFVRDSIDRGIGQYTYHHLLALARNRPGATLRLLSDRRDGSDRISSLLSLPNVEIHPWCADSLREADIYHVPDPMGRPYLGADPFALALPGRTSSIFYDVIPRRMYWESTPSELKELDATSLRAVAEKADTVLCISEHTRHDFLIETGKHPSGTEVILGGCNRGPHRGAPVETDGVRRRLGIKEKYFLHVGSIDPHKNLGASLNAFAAVRRARECSFVVVGRKLASHRDTEQAVREAGLVDVVFTDFLEPAELDALYREAAALLYPSRYEGFGFPVLEAMAAGCPVIASNATSVPEVAGDAALSRSPDDIDGIASDMARLLDEPTLRRDLSERGKARASLFRWEDVAERTWRHWDVLLAKTPRRVEEAAEPARIQWISPVWDPSGYADESRAFLKHLASTDLGVSAKPWGRHSETFRQAAPEADRRVLDAALIREIRPGSPVVLEMPAHAMGRLPGAGHHVGRTFFETDGLPPDWVARCNTMDEIWASCTFNKATFAKAGVTRPILVVPGGVDTDRFRPGLAPLEIPGPGKATTYLAVFEWTHRKAPDLLLQAWAKAFAATDDVRLVLRTYPPNQIEGDPAAWVETKIDEELARIGKRRSDCAPIEVLAKQVPDADMPHLYAASDVYLAPSRGEGWGRPHMEAMSCGVPVVATRWSGNLDFQTDDNSWLIDIDGLEEIDAREEFPFYHGQKWAKPFLARFVELLRESRDDLPLRRRKAERARRDMVENWDWSKIAPLAETRLREILAGIPADRSALAIATKPAGRLTDSVKPGMSIRWAGPVFNYSGYARLARETLKGLMDAGTPVSCDPQLNDKEFFAALSGKDAEIARWKNLLGTTPIKGPLVVCDIPRDAKGADVLAALARDNAACDKRICWTMFESDRLPQGWAAALNTMDEVWVPSQFNRNTFARAGVQESKLHVIPGCIDAVPYASAAPMPIPGTGYTFLSVFQWIERKGYDVLLDAWSRAFKSTDPVRLVLRCHPFGSTAPVSRQLEQFLSNRGLRRQDLAPIHLIEEFLPDDALPGLFAASDCFVLPSRGEGWGLPYLEAMAAGKPVVGTRWSAQTDFLTTDNSWLLSPRNPVQVGDAACREVPFLDAAHRWADPSADELAKTLRHAFEHPEEGRAKGRQGRLDATTKWTPARTARAIVDRLSAPAQAVRSAAPLDPVGQARVSDALAKVASGIKATLGKSAGPPPGPVDQFLSIRWEGSQFVHHSLAHVNRELCLRLAKKGHDLSLVPFEPDQFGPGGDADLSLLAQLHNAPLEGPCQVHVRHQWPPNLEAPAQGKWVVIQPWEFGSPPKEWIPVFSRKVDQLWAYTNHVRDMYLEAGIPADKVFVVPLGVDCDKFRPGLSPFALATRKTFKFLYVGGTIARKGFDALLNAWKEAFGPHDDVCLVVKDMGGGSFYKGQTAKAWIQEMQVSRQYAEIEYLDGDLEPGQIPSLYTACDVLVHPYRGEGFGLPIAEAMACGLPCVTTRGGAADDFCGESESWGVQAERVPVPGGKVGPFETVAAPWWLEPSVPHLVERLREAFSDPAARKAKGEAARERISNHFTWEQAAAIAEARLMELARQESAAPKPAPGRLTISSLDKLARSITMESAKRKPSDDLASKVRADEDDMDEMGRMLLLAEASAARGGLAEAGRITEDVVGKFPRQNMAWLARAMVLRGLGKFKKASEAIDQAILLHETPEALLESIQIHILTGEKGTARKLAKALKERHAAWVKLAREEFRATGKPWPPDFLKPAKASPSAKPK